MSMKDAFANNEEEHESYRSMVVMETIKFNNIERNLQNVGSKLQCSDGAFI